MDDPDKRVSLRDLVQKPIRLRKELIRQVDKIRVQRGQTFQTFVQLAIIKAVADANDEHTQSKTQPQQKRSSSAPRGLGIRERLDEAYSDSDSAVDEAFESVAPSAASPVTVNVGTTAPATAGSGDLATLARMVVEGPRHDRRRLLESACKALSRLAHTPEESLQLAEQLDVEIKRIDVPTTALERVRARRNR